MPDIVEIIKKAAHEVNEASKPMNIVLGTVMSISPLIVSIDQRIHLTEEFLILTKQVTDHYVDVVVNLNSELEGVPGLGHSHTCPEGSTSTGLSNAIAQTKHRHKIKGTKKILMKYGLKVGDDVLLVRVQGGQKYVILDTIKPLTPEGEWEA